MNRTTHDPDIEELRARLEAAEALVDAIRGGDVDALVVGAPGGERLYTLSGADRPYRIFVEAMSDGAITVGRDGTVLFANHAFGALVEMEPGQVIGRPVAEMLSGLWPPSDTGADFRLHGHAHLASGRTIPVALSRREVAVDGASFTAVVVRDLSDHVQARLLLDRETQLHLLLEASSAVTFEWDVVHDRVRRPFSRETALPITSEGGDTFEDVVRVVHPEDRARFRTAVETALRHPEGTYRSEHRVVRPGGEVRWLRASGRVEFDEARHPLRLLGISYEVTAHVEAALRQREHDVLLRTVLESTPDLVWAKDVDGRITLANQATLDLLGGGDPHRVLGRDARELVQDPEQARDILANDARIIAAGRAELVEEAFGSPDEPLIFETKKSPLRDATGHVVGIVGVSRDVTEARAIEQELREAQERYRRATRVGRALVYDFDVAGDTLVTDGLPEVLGYPDSGSTNRRSWLERMHPDDRDEQLSRFAAWAAHGDTQWSSVYRLRHVDGRWLDVVDVGEAERDADGRVSRVVGTVQDVTDRRRAETAALEHAQQLDLLARVSARLLIDGAPEPELLATVFRDIGQQMGVESYYHYRLTEEPDLLRLHLADGVTADERAQFATMRFGELLCGRVAESRAPLIVEALQTSGVDGSEALAAAGIQSYAGFPLVARGELLGTVAFVSRRRTRFRDGDLQMVGAVCDLVAATLDRHRLFAALSASHDRLEANSRRQACLVELGDALRMLTDAAEIQHAAAEVVRHTLGISGAVYARVRPGYAQVVGASHGGRRVNRMVPFEALREDFVAALRRGETVSTVDVTREDHVVDSSVLRHVGAGACVAVPIMRDGELAAAFGVYDPPPRAWTADELELVREVAERTRLAMDRAEAQAALLESEERFRRMADQTPVILWVTDANGDLEFVNGTFCAFFGVTLEDVRGPGWQQLVHPDDDRYVAAFMTALRARAPFSGTARVRRWDGEWRWIQSTGQPRFGAHHEFLGMIGVSPDVTEHREATRIEREAAKQKDEFIAVLAHELRNPLAPIRTAVGVLRARGPLTPALVTCRDIIDRQVSQMARLLDDLLDVSRLSRGTLTLQPQLVRLRDVMATAVETARPLIEEKQHQLHAPAIDDGLVLHADGARLTQIFANLLNNAAKYTPPRGSLTLFVEPDDAAVTVTVRDNGIGIAPEMRDRVFDLFTQVEQARPHAHGGLGIGLGLTKRLVEMHGGTVTLESNGVGQGSTFIVRLPLDHAATTQGTAGAPQKVGRLGDGPAHRKVLVVDDNVDAADMLGMLLEIEGCDVRTVYSGEAALVEACTFQPDMVLLDLGMPGLDGSTVCKRLRDEPWATHVVIAAVTGWGQAEDRRRTKNAGFDHHLVKPVDPDRLARLVRDLPMVG